MDRFDYNQPNTRERIAARLDRTETKLRRLVASIAEGDAPASVMGAIRDIEASAVRDHG